MSCLYYVHDPMCSWCWAFGSTWKNVQSNLPSGLNIKRILGGLAPDTDATMPEDMKNRLIMTWHRIEQTIPGIKFNFEFWNRNDLRRTTYPACRAVLAARNLHTEFDEAMTEAIQTAYYQQARNPANENTLIEMAQEIGLDKTEFTKSFRSVHISKLLENEISFARSIHADSFPSLILEHKSRFWPVAIDYNNHIPVIELIAMILNNQ